MTVTEVTENKTRQYLNQFMKKLLSDRCCLGLLRFFVVHPNGRFSKLAVLHAVDENATRPQIENDLEKLIDQGVIKTSFENGTTYYLLTRDEPTRHLVLNLAEFDWRQWQRLDHYYVADRRIPA